MEEVEQPSQSPHQMGRLTQLSPHPAANCRRPRSATETWRRTSVSCRSGWRCCRLRELQASLSPAPSQEGAGWRWATLGVWTLGTGEESRLGHAAAPLSFSGLHAPYTSSLLLPAVTGVPSPRATDPPSHVRSLSSPTPPPAQSCCPQPDSPAILRAHPPWGLRQEDASTQPASPSKLFPQFRPLAKSFPREPPKFLFCLWPCC